MKLEGSIKLIKEVQIITEKFAKREFVLTIPDGNYPQDVIMEMTNDNCAILDSFQPGNQVEVEVNLRGREWVNPQGESKYFNTLQAWRISTPATQNESTPQGLSTKVQGNIEKRFQDDAINSMTEEDDFLF